MSGRARVSKKLFAFKEISCLKAHAVRLAFFRGVGYVFADNYIGKGTVLVLVMVTA